MYGLGRERGQFGWLKCGSGIKLWKLEYRYRITIRLLYDQWRLGLEVLCCCGCAGGAAPLLIMNSMYTQWKQPLFIHQDHVVHLFVRRIICCYKLANWYCMYSFYWPASTWSSTARFHMFNILSMTRYSRNKITDHIVKIISLQIGRVFKYIK